MTRTILEEYAERMGWNEDSQLEILCDYIENQQNPDAFDDYLSRRADEENLGYAG